MSALAEEFGRRLQEARRAKGWSQGDLAAESGVSKGNLSDWENGSVEPGVLKAAAMAQALGVSLDALTAPEVAP